MKCLRNSLARSFHVDKSLERNSLGFEIEVYQVVGTDKIVYAESRHEEIAALLANQLTAKLKELR